MTAETYIHLGTSWKSMLRGHTVSAAARKMQIGASGNDLTQFNSVETKMGVPMNARRSYGTVPQGIPASFSACSAGDDVGKRISWFSVKTDIANIVNGSLDGAIRTFIASIPAGHRTYLTLWHEPDVSMNRAEPEIMGTLTKADAIIRYRNASTRFNDLVHEPGRPELATYVCVTGMPYRRDSGYTEDSFYVPTADVLTVDLYNVWPKTGFAWASLQQRLTEGYVVTPLAFARSKGKKLAITETSAHEDVNLPNRKATWITEAIDWCMQEEILAILWWDNYFGSEGTGGGDLTTTARLLDSTAVSLQAWTDKVIQHGGTP